MTGLDEVQIITQKWTNPTADKRITIQILMFGDQLQLNT